MVKHNKRRCPKCLKLKSLEDFKQRADGYYVNCYDCELRYYREYNAKRYKSPQARREELARGKDKYRSEIKPARTRRKIRLIMLMGGACQGCGYSRSAAALDFDHIDPAMKLRTISHLLAIQDPEAWTLAVEEAKKCRLLCSNCHREITFPGFEIEAIATTPVVLKELCPARYEDGVYIPQQIAF